jgi:RNA polymerase sporulation-specific sigma factor
MFSILSAVLSNMLFLMLHLENAGSFPKPLTAAQEREALEKMKQGDASARDKLVEHNLRLVVHIIKKYYANYSDQDDLISIGTIGLIKAVNSFDSDKGTRLATYASRCIENEILMYFRNQKKSAQDVSMHEPIDIDAQGNPLTLSEIIFTDDTIVDDIDKKLKLERLRQAVAGIEDPREKLIIVRRYGLDGRMPLTQREIAKQLNISRSYVSRIEKKVLHNLRKAFDGD